MNKRIDMLHVSEDVHVTGAFGVVELFVEMDGDSVVVVPLDDCMIEVVWSDKHQRMVGVIREKLPIKE